MKNQLLLVFASILTINTYAQINFEKGYYINNENQKVECLIKNVDWKNNPTEFDYKLNENTEQKTLTINMVKEFGISKVSKYIRTDVKIDKSSEAILNLSSERKPNFEEDTLFLKILVEGKASLYQYFEGNLEKYFYNKKNSKIEQLVFKSYRTSNNTISKNIQYKQQLINHLSCPSFSENKIKNLKYDKKDLIRFFVDYNECHNEPFTNFEKEEDRNSFDLNIRSGLNISTLSIRNSLSSSRDTDFKKQFTFRFGIEAEFFMPFNKGKWSVIVEPTYQYFNATHVMNNEETNVVYKSAEFPIGIRHNFFVRKNAKIFVNSSVVFDITPNSFVNLSSVRHLEIGASTNFVFGLGYKQNDKFSLECRYFTPRDLLINYVTWRGDYRTLSIILGYTLF